MDTSGRAGVTVAVTLPRDGALLHAVEIGGPELSPAIGHLFADDRQEGAPYCLFVEYDGDTLEIRFRDLWEFVSKVSVMREEVGVFELRLGEPGHYAEIAEDFHGERS